MAADLANLGSGLSGALGVAAPDDGSLRVFVVRQGGEVRTVRNDVVQATPYFAVSSGFQCRDTFGGPLQSPGFTSGGERGLLGMAFHPEFRTNGHVFVSYTDANGDSIVARLTTSAPGADVIPTADLQTCVMMLRVDQDFSNHNGGNILFGPDGYLYFGLGDGGSGDDPCNRGQTLDPAALAANNECAPDTSFPGNPDSRALLGKLVRIDVDHSTPPGSTGLCGARPDGSANYAVPAGNPFLVNAGCDETHAYGLRNPWRWSFDRANGDLLLADVGQGAWEEVNLVPSNVLAGRNFDWKVCEGRHATSGDRCTSVCGGDSSEVIFEYPNSGANCGGLPTTSTGCSVTGGFRYRYLDPDLAGIYFYGDACRGQLRWATESGGVWTPSPTVLPVAGAILGFGEDEAGVLYFVGGGTLYRVGPGDRVFGGSFE